jgi:hypothetical protein
MKFLIAFFFCLSLSAQDWYVVPGGAGSQTGINEANAFATIQAGVNAAQPGDIVAVKAGNYGAEQVNSVRSGTSGSPIIIEGYTTTYGDIDYDNTTGPTYTWAQYEANADALPTNVMPYLNLNPPDNNPSDKQNAFDITHQWIELRNIMVSEYMIGYDIQANNVTVWNCYGDQFGNFSTSSNCYNSGSATICDNANGYAVRTTGRSNVNLYNCMMIDAGMDTYFMLGWNNSEMKRCEAYTKDYGNGTDYMINLNKASFGNVVEDCYASREYVPFENGVPGTVHASRSFAIKCASTNNTFRNIHAKNARVQFLFSNSNLIDGLTLENESSRGNGAEIQINGDSNNNTIRNVVGYGGNGPYISFLTWDCGECITEGAIRYADYDSGSNNYFINGTIKGDGTNTNYGGAGFASFHRLGPQSKNSGTNYIIGYSVSDLPHVINADKDGVLNIYNTSFSQMFSTWDDTYGSPFLDARELYEANFFNCNFENSTNNFGSITDDLNSSSSESNTKNFAPGYTNESTGDFTLLVSSDLIDEGVALPLINPSASNDILGNARGAGSGWDIGAYEYNGTPPADTCSNGVQDGDELGVDCGGSCPPCAAPVPNIVSQISTQIALLIAH